MYEFNGWQIDPDQAAFCFALLDAGSDPAEVREKLIRQFNLDPARADLVMRFVRQTWSSFGRQGGETLDDPD